MKADKAKVAKAAVIIIATFFLDMAKAMTATAADKLARIRSKWTPSVAPESLKDKKIASAKPAKQPIATEAAVSNWRMEGCFGPINVSKLKDFEAAKITSRMMIARMITQQKPIIIMRPKK